MKDTYHMIKSLEYAAFFGNLKMFNSTLEKYLPSAEEFDKILHTAIHQRKKCIVDRILDFIDSTNNKKTLFVYGIMDNDCILLDKIKKVSGDFDAFDVIKNTIGHIDIQTLEYLVPMAFNDNKKSIAGILEQCVYINNQQSLQIFKYIVEKFNLKQDDIKQSFLYIVHTPYDAMIEFFDVIKNVIEMSEDIANHTFEHTFNIRLERKRSHIRDAILPYLDPNKENNKALYAASFHESNYFIDMFFENSDGQKVLFDLQSNGYNQRHWSYLETLVNQKLKDKLIEEIGEVQEQPEKKKRRM